MPHSHTPMPSLPVVVDNSYTYIIYTHYPVSTVRFQSDRGPRGVTGGGGGAEHHMRTGCAVPMYNCIYQVLPSHVAGAIFSDVI